MQGEGNLCMHDFSIGKVIAQGRQSCVRLANSRKTSQQFAVKILKKANPESSSRDTRVFNETILAILLKHPNMVQVVDVVDTGSQFYQFMPVAEYGDLLHFLKTRQLTPPLAIKVCDQLLCAVEYLHSIGICHCDITLENILLGRHASIRLSGLGSAVVAFDSKVRGPVGTYEYSAPEATKQQVFDGFKADMWSVGVVMYAIFNGQMPFKHVTADYKYELPSLGKIPEQLRAMVQALLSIDPQARPSATECRANPIFASGFERVRPPLSSLRGYSNRNRETGLLVSTLSQVLKMPLNDLKSKISASEVNREKLLLLLYKRRAFMNLDARPEKDQYVNVPGFGKNAVIQSVNKFPTTGLAVYAEMRKLLMAKHWTVSSPLAESPVIIVQDGDVTGRLSFNLADDEEGNCILMISAEPETKGYSSYIMAHLSKCFK